MGPEGRVVLRGGRIVVHDRGGEVGGGRR
jgi:hypothetical protein